MRTLLGMVVLLSIVLGAFGRKAGAVEPRKVVQIGEIGDRVRVSLNTGDTLRVVLRATLSTGYSWQVAGNSNTLLAPGKIINLSPGSKLAGAPGRQQFSFQAAAPGNDHLVLTYIRPWEKHVKPARSLTLEITIAHAGTSLNPALAVKPSGQLLARYSARLPCADCSGILETLSLYSPGPNQFVDAYYVDAMTYIGRPAVYVSAGKFFMSKGTPFNPNASVYALSLDSSERDQNYLIRGDILEPLDDKLNLVHSPYSLPLKRVSQ